MSKWVWMALLLILMTPNLALSSVQRDVILNTADFSSNSTKFATSSVSATIIVCTTSKLEFLKYAPLSTDAEMVNVPTTKYMNAPGSYIPMQNPVPVGSTSPLDLSLPIPLIKADVYHEGEPIFLRLSDMDQNIDTAVAETILLTMESDGNGEKETLVLTETGQDTGVFLGYIQSAKGSAIKENGFFSVYENCQIIAKYEDKCGPNGTGINTIVAATALVDPFGVVFDTSNGQPVNGATVTLVNVNTGSPAIVYGDDGVSAYPSTVTTGGTASDSSGVVYTFSPGGYRFPFIAPGRYRLDVVPPSGYRAPSIVATSDLLNLPGGSFVIVNPGSRGEDFFINPGPAIHIDLPVDPLQYVLYLTKTAAKSTVSIGDFLQYRITVENTGLVVVSTIQVNDRLPLGFRYRQGSTKIDGVAAPDPSISDDGKTMIFNVGSLAPGKTAAITYIVEISAGAKFGKAENSASGTGAGLVVSNMARAEVLVKEDLLESRAIIMGRVFPGCGEKAEDKKMGSSDDEQKDVSTSGVSGVRIYLEDGTYVVTDRNGMYHFEGVKPGTHVVQLDLVTIPSDYELISCVENDRFAGTQFSQFVDLQGGTMWRADFYLKEKPKAVEEIKETKITEIKGAVGIELSSVLKKTEDEKMRSLEDEKNLSTTVVEYEVSLHVEDVPVSNLRLSVVLPEGVEYRKGSSSLEDAALPDPDIIDNVLTYRISDAEEGWKGRLKLRADVPHEGKNDDLVARAFLVFDSPGAVDQKTPMVENILRREIKEERKENPDITLRPNFEEFGTELTKEDRAMLDRIIEDLKKMSVKHMFVTGHTNSTRISPRSRHIHADNYALSLARAESVGPYIAMGLGLSPSQITMEGKGPDEPIASNKTAEGRALNRRVELRIISDTAILWPELMNIKDRSGIERAETTSVKVLETSPVEKKEEQQAGKYKIQEKEGIVSPSDGSNMATRISAVRICLSSNLKPRLLLDGKEISSERIGFTMSEKESGKTIYSYIGVDIGDPGDHLLLLQGLDPFGNVRFEDKAALTRSGEIASIRLLSAEGNVADGKTPVKTRLQFLETNGKVINAAAQLEIKEGDLRPYANDPAAASTGKTALVQVDADGWATFQPVIRSGPYRTVLAYNNATLTVETYVKPEMRDWILVGLAEGTAGYNTVSGNMESLGSTGVDDGYYKDGRLAFFAKGMIKGKWLLTIAYDSDKNGNIRRNDSLHQMIDPNRYYTLYGDATQQGYEAASARSLYVKLERDNFYALFGDFETGLNVTELSRYSRNLNGLKSEMKGERFDFKVFASDTNQAFIKDEIRGDGTSGLYRLSRKNIVMNSESIVIETRDRFRSEVLISSQSLSRYIDYSIDYETGSIYFKSPVFSRDENFNPIYIVVNYESFDMSDMSYNYGGRGAVRLMDNRLEVGATHVHEGSVGGEGNLEGIDATVKITDKTSVRTELATTSTDMNGSGSAYIAELSRKSEKLAGKVYVREQDVKFGLGQQRGSETGTRKLGYDGTYLIDERFSLRSEAFRQYNIAVDSVRDMAAVQIQYNEKTYELHAGLRHAEDTLGNGDANRSEQITTGGSFRLMDNRLTLRLEHDQSMLRNNTNSDFPTRTTMGADYKLNDTATLFVAEEFTQGESEDTETTRIGLKASPWSGGQISSSMEQQYSENGTRVFAVTGLKQSYKINAKWSVDAGLERSEILKHPGNSQFNTNVPASSGGSDFTAISGGAAYKEEKWSWTGRVETRNSDSEDKVGLFTGAYGEFKEGIGLAAALQAFRTEYASGAEKESGDLRFGLAYRPKETKWIVLDRLDFLVDKQNGSSFNYNNWRIINNMNANYKADSRTQVSLQYGSKYVNETIDGNDYSGYTDLTGLEGRYDITKKWDIGLRGNILHSWDADQYRYGYGPSVGYSFVKNVWLSVGYNIAGFRDRDFSRADFTSEGPFVKFRMKFDQGTAKDAVKWFSGQ